MVTKKKKNLKLRKLCDTNMESHSMTIKHYESKKTDEKYRKF